MSAVHYRPDIQGLRAIAVLAVMLFHFNPAWLPGGFVGVDVFLVISGFLIVKILLQKKSQSGYQFGHTLQYFYGSRIKRIAPAYFAMLVLVSLLAAILFLPQDLDIYKKSLNKAAWFSSNNYFAGFGDYFAPSNHEQPLLHTWSLAVEIQFYLLIPLLVLLLPVNAMKGVFAALLVGLTAWAHYHMSAMGLKQATYYSLWARLPEFLAGGLVALYSATGVAGNQRGAWHGTVGLFLMLGAAVIQPQLGPFPGLSALVPVAGAVLVLWDPVHGFSQRVLANRGMVWLGELSYSLYLWHWPVLALLRYYTGEQVLNMPFSMLFVALTLCMATLSFYLLERPWRIQRTVKWRTLAYGLLAFAAIGISQSIAAINQALSPPNLDIQYQRYADPATICHGQIVGDCLRGDLSSGKEVLVLGDSHAAMLNLFFDVLGRDLGFKARIITASSCVPIPGFDYQRIPEWAHKSCLAQIEEARKYLPDAKTLIVAAMWNWQLDSSAFQQVMQDFLQAQSEEGKKIYVMAQEPLLASNPQRTLRFVELGLPSRMGIDPAYQQSNKWLAERSQRLLNIEFLSFEGTGLFIQAPFYQGKLIYFDAHHLNEVGAKEYAKVVKNKFQQWPFKVN